MGLALNDNVLKTGTLASTAATANQVILTYTVPDGKTFFLNFLEANVRLTTFATTATHFGPATFRQNGVVLFTFLCAGPGVLNAPIVATFPNALPFQAGDVLTVVTTPTGVTPFTWEANMAGFLQ